MKAGDTKPAAPARDLEELIARETALPITGAARHWVSHFKNKPGVAAILFYGSGLWKSDKIPGETVFDFYVLTPRFRDFDGRRALACAGTLIPPNVYYYEEDFEGSTLRCKVAVMTVKQFLEAARAGSFTPHIWARFCQPCRIAHTADEAVRVELVAALADAVRHFHRRTLHLITRCAAVDFWHAGLQSTYADEIRSEKTGRLRELYHAAEGAFAERTRLALGGMPEAGRLGADDEVESLMAPGRKRLYRARLRLKRPLTKAVIVARFVKAGFTFQGALDYAAWKIQRHSGVRIEVTDFHRRHPLVGGVWLLVKVLWCGGLR